MFGALMLVVATYVLVPLLQPLFVAQSKQNYHGHSIPSALGFTFVLSSVVVLISGGEGMPYLFAIVMLYFAILGLVDDLLGESDSKGIRGHFGRRTLSTGTLKALGAMGFTFALSLRLPGGWLETIINAILIASAANFLNLLDLRPGRTGKAFIIFAFPFIALAPSLRDYLLWILGAVVGYLPWDLREQVMMGDTGSNPLGATLGLAAVMVLPQTAKTILALVLVGLNLLAERISFSRVIEDNRLLDFLDRLGR